MVAPLRELQDLDGARAEVGVGHAFGLDLLDRDGIKSYNGNGLLPVSINYSNDFGKDAAKSCGWYMIAEKNGFVPASTTPTCGTDIPGTSTASS